MKEIIKAFHNQKLTKLNGHNYLINPVTDHTPETSYALLKDIVQELSKLADFPRVNKIVGEEDRGGYISALMAMKQKKSLAMVKWNPLDLKGQIAVNFRNAYTDGKMYLYGVKKGDRVILVEDLIDTGGTVIAMIQLLRKHGVIICDVIAIAAKDEYRAIERIKKETGIEVKHLLKFSCTGKKSKVVEVKGKRI